ncbi:MAG: hypothetical protein MUP74_01640 [Desulfobacterales bacterium]|nr:hypothetical protein [Desulfobacterales bacterium]
MLKPNDLTTLALLALAATGCGRQSDLASEEGRTPAGARETGLDERSYRLGSIGTFAEMVDAGVKRLALSAAVEPGEMDALVDEAGRIARDHDVELFRETDFLVTDLFPADLTEGKHVLLIYRGDTRREYMELKADPPAEESSG